MPKGVYVRSPEYLAALNEAFRKRSLNPEWQEQHRKQVDALNASPEHREHLRRIHADPAIREKMGGRGKVGGAIVGRRNVETGFLDKIRPQAVVASRRGLKPTEPEKIVRDKLGASWRYTGDNSFAIVTKRHTRYPDFVNEKERKCIEVFGNYWHSRKWFPEREAPEDKIAEYAEVGWQCEVVWEKDVKKWLPANCSE
jgi:G:T-mismatch repair DNA endonuclease (very short patch repair protein)